MSGSDCAHCGWTLLPAQIEGAELDASFAENMTRLREAHGIRQSEMVQKLRERGWTNVHPTTIARIEKGERPVRLSEAAYIASVLNEDLYTMLIAPDESEQLIEAREQYRALRQDQTYVLEAVQRFYTQAVYFARFLAADRDARKLLPQRELREMVKDAKKSVELGRKLLADLGQTVPPTLGPIIHFRLGTIETDLGDALQILDDEASDEPEA